MRTTVKTDPEVKTSASPILQTKETKEIATNVLSAAMLAVQRAINHAEDPEKNKLPVDKDSLEAIFFKRWQTLKPERRQQVMAQSTSRTMPASNEVTKQLLSQPEISTLKALNRSTSRVTIDFDTLMGELPSFGKGGVVDYAAKKAKVKSTLYNELQFRVRSVECIDDTKGWGDDDISIGGAAIFANGKTITLPALLNEYPFETGETKTFDPPKVFANFKFEDEDTVTYQGKTYPIEWPRAFMVLIIMVEEDLAGDFPDEVAKIVNQIKDSIKPEIESAVAGAIGGVIGGPMGTAIGSAVGYVVSKILDWVIVELISLIKEWYEDDLFPVRSLSVTINTPYLPEPVGTKTHSSGHTKWIGWHEGEYKLNFDWRLKGDLIDPADYHGDSELLKTVIPTPGAISWHPTSSSRERREEVFMRGLDRKIYRSFRYDNAWSNWGTFPNNDATFKSAPAVTSWKNGRLELFALGEDNKIYQNSLNNMDWSGWGNPYWKDFLFQYSLATVSRKPNYVDLFAVGMDRRIYNFIWNGQSWSSLRTDLPMGTFLSAPAVASRSADRLDVIALGDDRRIYLSSWKEGRGKWSDWSAIGIGTFTSAPSMCSWDKNRLHVFGRGEDRKIYHASYDESSGWSNWSNEVDKSGTFLSGPISISQVPGRIDLYAVGDDQSMWRNVFDGTKWSGWFNDFKPGTFK